ncbi:MAG: hypothetical protein HY897_21705 [Deltaproteobacteria bacterium]|nr:hypothetical protein [Deltaproteobacteria bacterium]
MRPSTVRNSLLFLTLALALLWAGSGCADAAGLVSDGATDAQGPDAAGDSGPADAGPADVWPAAIDPTVSVADLVVPPREPDPEVTLPDGVAVRVMSLNIYSAKLSSPRPSGRSASSRRP